MYTRHRYPAISLVAAAFAALILFLPHARATSDAGMRVWHGTVIVPDPSNWWTGARNTGEPCSVEVKPGTDRDTLLVRSTLWANLTTDFHEARLWPPADSFWRADLPDGHVTIVQFWEKDVVAVTFTTYDEKGEPNYGVKGGEESISDCEIELKRR